MQPEFLSALVRLGMNKKVFKPTAEAIKARYYEKYRGLDKEAPAPATRPRRLRRARAPARARIHCRPETLNVVKCVIKP